MTDSTHLIKTSVRALEGYVPGEQPADRKIIKLNTNENPYPPAPGVEAVLRSLPADVLRRYPNPTSERLRADLAEHYGLPMDSVIAGNGSDEILALCTRAFVEDDQAIGFLDPSYSLYPVLSAIRDVKTRITPLDDDFTWDAPDTDGCGLFMLANPNAPTGMAVSCDQIRTFCRNFNGVVVVDEAYAEFADENALKLAAELPNVLVVRTFSKSYALAGARVGYALGAPALIDALMRIKDSYNVNAVSQAVAQAALADGDYFASTVQRIRDTRSRLSRVLEASGWTVLPSQANFILAKPMPLDARTVFDGLRAHGILVRYFARSRVSDYIRISIGTDDEIDALLAALDEMKCVDPAARAES